MIQDLKKSIANIINDIIATEPNTTKRLIKIAEEMLRSHLELLKPYGTVIGHDVDSIYFSPDPKRREELESLDYFCRSGL